MADQYILGYGALNIAGTDLGLSRGGGVFTVEREYREVVADGDYGPVKDRNRLIRSVAKLSFNMLEILSSNLTKMYPGMTLDTTTTPGTATLKPKETDVGIETGDYNDTITWTGKDSEGRDIIITIENAINMGNISWTMTDKEEVVLNIEWTATYLPTARTTEPWKVDYVDAA